MYRDEMIQIRALGALEDIETICATSTACYRCPFCRYENTEIMKSRIYKASELCALYEVFGKVPRAIDASRLEDLFQEGRIGRDEILHEEDAEGSEPAGWAETPDAAPDGRSE
ncbi:MAG: hypothetical protein IKG01_08215 [Lachnospiraceae bacterium]|nr:hypothetical protein [Lachnospiraceae bacterium]